ncbi:MAG: FHA domain-containing protein [Solirubrobacteraceae bacterium]|jgi:DNA-directed RNA polymerase subunit RPC12/RpoP
MTSVTSGTDVGAGSFSCDHCGYTLTLLGSDTLTACPGCGGRDFVRASLFSHEQIDPATSTTVVHNNDGELVQPPAPDRAVRLALVRQRIKQPGEYLCYEESGEQRTIALTREWTRVGRSLAADVRFDDPTVSRRHALIVRHADGVRLLDDRSLNGVFVNGARVDGRTLQDGDEIIVGRYRLAFLSVPAGPGAEGTNPETTSLHSIS